MAVIAEADSAIVTMAKGSDKLHRLKSIRLKKCEPMNLTLDTILSFKNLIQDIRKCEHHGANLENSTQNIPTSPESAFINSPHPVTELNAAAIKLQKVYKSYRTRRNLADCAVVVEELWWKALDFAALKRSSVSFFDVDKPETAASRWARARTMAAKVGKGLCNDEKAQKLALQHWLEAIDPRHRYGHNLHLYYDEWFRSESVQPFFYWLDIGDGKEVNLDKCSKSKLQHQCIKYLGPKERESYEVVVRNGRLAYKQNGALIDTIEGSKWIFVLSTTRTLYIGQKKKGLFQHSSFLAGAATTSAGRLVAHGGLLEAIWPYSGHYLPTEENFQAFISFLEDHKVDLVNVKRCAMDDDCLPVKLAYEESTPRYTGVSVEAISSVNQNKPVCNMAKRKSFKWSSGAGPRIGCVREYPAELQFRALEKVNLSPRLLNGSSHNDFGPIPSPRPCPNFRLSPRVTNLGLPSPPTPCTESRNLGLPSSRILYSESRNLGLPSPRTPYSESRNLGLPSPRTPYSESQNLGLPSPLTPYLEIRNLGLPSPRTPYSEIRNLGLPSPRTPYSEIRNLGLPSPRTPYSEVLT